MNYEQEEEFLTNDLSRKLHQVCVDGKIIAWSYSAESEKVVMTGERHGGVFSTRLYRLQ